MSKGSRPGLQLRCHTVDGSYDAAAANVVSMGSVALGRTTGSSLLHASRKKHCDVIDVVAIGWVDSTYHTYRLSHKPGKALWRLCWNTAVEALT